MKVPFFNRAQVGRRLPVLDRVPGDKEAAGVEFDIRKGQQTLKEVIDYLQKNFPNHRYDEFHIVLAEKGKILIVADMNIAPNKKI